MSTTHTCSDLLVRQEAYRLTLIGSGDDQSRYCVLRLLCQDRQATFKVQLDHDGTDLIQAIYFQAKQTLKKPTLLKTIKPMPKQT